MKINRREFIKLGGIGIIGAIGALLLPKAEPVHEAFIESPIVDMSEFANLNPDELGGFVVPIEYHDQILEGCKSISIGRVSVARIAKK